MLGMHAQACEGMSGVSLSQSVRVGLSARQCGAREGYMRSFLTYAVRSEGCQPVFMCSCTKLVQWTEDAVRADAFLARSCVRLCNFGGWNTDAWDHPV